jgi:hypothetical protein
VVSCPVLMRVVVGGWCVKGGAEGNKRNESCHQGKGRVAPRPRPQPTATGRAVSLSDAAPRISKPARRVGSQGRVSDKVQEEERAGPSATCRPAEKSEKFKATEPSGRACGSRREPRRDAARAGRARAARPPPSPRAPARAATGPPPRPAPVRGRRAARPARRPGRQRRAPAPPRTTCPARRRRSRSSRRAWWHVSRRSRGRARVQRRWRRRGGRGGPAGGSGEGVCVWAAWDGQRQVSDLDWILLSILSSKHAGRRDGGSGLNFDYSVQERLRASSGRVRRPGVATCEATCMA